MMPDIESFPRCLYQLGKCYEKTGDLIQARAAYQKAANYEDASERVELMLNGVYEAAEAAMAAECWEEAGRLYAQISGYMDADEKLVACQNEPIYRKAMNSLAEGDIDSAIYLLHQISGYRDADEQVEAALDSKMEAYQKVGSTVTFGHYPQTQHGADQTPIEWIVLEVQGDKALLISRYGLDAQPYNKGNGSVTWEKCTLRPWLNSTFLNKAFTAEEQTSILLTNVNNSNSQGYDEWSTGGGSNTQDKVFLLSYAEANKYFDVTYSNSRNTKSQVRPTAYAIIHGAYTSSIRAEDGTPVGWWWLRSPGNSQKNAASVFANGSVFIANVTAENGCVRPAMWINYECLSQLIRDSLLISTPIPLLRHSAILTDHSCSSAACFIACTPIAICAPPVYRYFPGIPENSLYTVSHMQWVLTRCGLLSGYFSFMGFFSSAVDVLSTLVIALGAGLGVWGLVNLLEGYGGDNPGAKSQGVKHNMAE